MLIYQAAIVVTNCFPHKRQLPLYTEQAQDAKFVSASMSRIFDNLRDNSAQHTDGQMYLRNCLQSLGLFKA